SCTCKMLTPDGVLTVTAVASGILGAGVVLVSNAFFFPILITAQLTGPAGGAGTYQTNQVGFTFGSGTGTRISGPWEANNLIATANGLDLNQYESGSQFVGN